MKNILFATIVIAIVTTLSSFYWSFPGSWNARVGKINDVNVFVQSKPYHPYEPVAIYPLPMEHGQSLESYTAQVIRFAEKMNIKGYESLVVDESGAEFIKSKKTFGHSASNVARFKNTYVYVNSKPARDYRVIKEITTSKEMRPFGSIFNGHVDELLCDNYQLVESGKMKPFEAIIFDDENRVSFIKFTLPYARQSPRR